MKKLLSLCLTVLLIIGMLAGCVSDADPTQSSQTVASSSSETSPSTEPEEIDGPTTESATEPTTESTTEPATDPVETQPIEKDPTIVQPESTQPNPTEPESSKPGVSKPEVTEPDSTKPNTTYPTQTQPEQIEREWIELQVWTPVEDQGYDDGWLHEMMERFEAEHPEYKITWYLGTCSEGDAVAKVTADVFAAADVYMFANDQMGRLIQAEALAQLTGDYKAQVQNDNSKALVNSVTYTDGNIYGFPITNNTWYMYYNKNIFTEKDVKSLDTMLTKGKVAFPMSTAWYAGSFFMSNGCTLFGEKGINANAGIQFGGEKGYAAAKKMVELMQDRNFVNDQNGLGCAELVDGSIGAYFSGSWDYANLSSALGDDLGVAQLPTVEIGGKNVQMKAFAGSKCIGVNPCSENIDAAMKLASFLASPESQLLRYEMRGIVPAAKTLASDSSVAQNPLAMAEINTMLYCSVAQPTIPEMGNYWDPMNNFGAAVVNGEVTLANYKEMVDSLVDNLNNSGW